MPFIFDTRVFRVLVGLKGVLFLAVVASGSHAYPPAATRFVRPPEGTVKPSD